MRREDCVMLGEDDKRGLCYDKEKMRLCVEERTV
jgi:hypothetical protein